MYLSISNFINLQEEFTFSIAAGDVPPTDLTPTPSDECASWKNIENALEFSFEGGYSVSDCVTLPGCRGFNCSATYNVSFHLFNIMYALTLSRFLISLTSVHRITLERYTN